MAELSVKVSDSYWPVIVEFKRVVDVVIEQEQTFDDYIELLLWRGVKGVIEDIIPKDVNILMETVYKMLEGDPEFVSGFIATTLQTGAEINAAKGRLGFIKK